MKKALSACILTLVFASCVDDSANLYGVWDIVELSDSSGNSIDLQYSERKVSITLDKERFNGYSGCNAFFGFYTIDGDQFQSSDSGMTKMLCEPRAMEIEESLIQLFSDTSVHFALQEGRLVFEQAKKSGAIKAIFEKQSK